ncbi:phage tail tape measure protein [Streptomyces fungicidicus]|uniref:phage tail tape measure protein n=1 Tax=Streptomyces fungicidicus TaxID=68203 RepID=UPI00369AF30E
MADAGGEAGQAAGGGLKDKLKVGAAGAAVAAGALLVKGLTDAMDQANITSKLQAQLGASNKDAAKYGKVAGQLYSSGVSDSFESAAEAIKSVMQSGIAPPGATNKQLQSIATKASDVANVFGQDMPAVTNAAAQAIRTGLVKNSGQAFDLITKGFQSGADKAGDFLDTINEYGTQFRKAGLDGATAVGLLNQGLKAGARDGDLVADAIKEFSIRAVDGSTTTAAGFKALGLNATQMAAKFGKGGKSATAALDTTLDRLRNIKDPVKQAQAATSLFGTQAEDLGKALFALDPSKAAKGLGKVGGAAKKVGDTIRSGPSYEIQTFTRRLQQGFVDIVGGTILPIVKDVVSWLADNLGPAIAGITSAVSDTVGWFQKWGVWLAPLGVLIGGIALALGASAIAAGISAAATATWATITGIAEAVTGGWAAAMGVLNAVMALNPFVLVAIAVAALVAAIVIAYKKSDTFRAIVQAAWQGIQTAALWAWNNVLKPTFEALKTAVSVVGQAFSWLWTNAISPAIGWIVAGFKLWWASIKIPFDAFVAGIKALASWATWLWKNAISPVVGWIVQGIKAMWSGVKTVFGYFTTGIKTVAGWVRWLWKNAVKPAWDGIKNAISTVWNSGIKPVFNTLKTAVSNVGKAFGAAKDAIRTAWDKLKSIARTPVKFIVDTVYNNGIRKVWNLVTDAFGGKHLSAMKFAAGGILPGYTPGRDVHTFYSPTAGWLGLSGGEAIMRPEVTRALGSSGVNALNAAARSGGVGAVRRQLGFAGGGIFGGIGDFLGGAWDKVKKGAKWLKDSFGGAIKSGVRSVVNPLIHSIPGASGFVSLLKSGMRALVDRLLAAGDKGDKLATPRVKYSPSKGVEQWRPVVLRALREVGQSAGLANSTLRRMQQESGGNPTIVNRTDSNWKAGHPSVGLMQVIGPTFRSYAGKYRGKGPFLYGVSTDPLANVYASMRYALGAYGSLSRAYDRPGGYDSGGWLKPGQTGVNGLRKPEAILTPVQSAAFVAMAAAAEHATRSPAVAPAARTAAQQPIVVEVHTKDEALAQFVDVRVHQNNQQIVTALKARPRR